MCEKNVAERERKAEQQKGRARDKQWNAIVYIHST